MNLLLSISLILLLVLFALAWGSRTYLLAKGDAL